MKKELKEIVEKLEAFRDSPDLEWTGEFTQGKLDGAVIILKNIISEEA